jgi:hypothetical protein
VAHVLKESKQKDTETLQTLLLLVGDLSPGVRETALQGVHGIRLRESDLIRLEDLLSRQSQDLRRGILQLLLELPDKKLLESIRRLSQHKGEHQHFAALELLKECKQSQRVPEQVQALAMEYKQRVTPSGAETILLKEILAESVETYSLDDALGLLNPQNRTKPNPVKAREVSKVKLGSPAAVACLKSLDALVEEHRNDVIEIDRPNMKVTELLGNIGAGWMLFTAPPARDRDFSDFPLTDVWETWWRTRSKDLRDDDGYELVRTLAVASLLNPNWPMYLRPSQKIPKEFQRVFDIRLDFELRYKNLVHSILEWLVWAHPVDKETDFILNALEESVRKEH